jgi:alanyl-tRNA synthetase
MKIISSQTLRHLFLDYFEKKGHVKVPSSSLIPTQDATLLFTNAGMVPFKAIFSGREPAPYPNATSIQRCMRAGGKHNDLENVGYTARHHTFFEMLGNFSFGHYFKREAIEFAWDFLTRVLNLPPERLWITVFEKDKEAERLWLDTLKVDPTRFSRCGEQDNFWAMGDTGPCGPCTEIFYDHGPHIAGGPPGSPTADGDRYVEIWNLVFMEYERTADQQLKPLATPCIDTGMGLERLCAVMQGVTNNYDTDLFQPLIQSAAQLLPQPNTAALHVIADHIRAMSFLILDGIIPANEGRAYVLRRIIRRALRHGYQTGLKEPFLYQLIPTCVQHMKSAYPELENAQAHIQSVVQQEEQQFIHTLHQGIKYFEKACANISNKTLSGEFVFKLYDTYGFPVDLTADLAREKGLDWDKTGFEAEMAIQQQRSQAKSQFSNLTTPALQLTTAFEGYTTLTSTAQIIGLLNAQHQPVHQLNEGEKGSIILDRTPFYAEAGGQIGDTGKVKTKTTSIFSVEDTQIHDHLYLHHGCVQKGQLCLQDTVEALVDIPRRQAIARHHSATHLLHAALRDILGSKVTQKGSLVTERYLRFDFNYPDSITASVLTQIEQHINHIILENEPVQTEIMSLEEAQHAGAMALFNEKYEQHVRVLKMGDFSIELCGGTHVTRTGDIGLFKITALSTIASGIKRIEAITGAVAFQWVKDLETQHNAIAHLLKSDRAQIMTRLEKQMTTLKEQTETIQALQHYVSRSLSTALLKQMHHLPHANLIMATLPPFMSTQARLIIDQLKAMVQKPLIILLGCITQDKTQISIGISNAYTSTLNAKEVVQFIAPLIQGKGGGRPDFAQVQSEKDDPALLRHALQSVGRWIKSHDNSGTLHP